MENSTALQEKLNHNTLQLLNCGDEFGQMKLAVDELYLIFSQITGVTIDQLNQCADFMLPTGKAISIAGAAHCLLEMKRTAVFLRGINQAILSKIDKKTPKPVRILYAGTGPYGTLVIPLLSIYQPSQLKVDLLDVNPDSLAALKKLIEIVGFDEYIGEVFCTDATTFTVTYPYDIVISETMLACLKSEPQVAVMQHLIPQLDEDCIFIPEEISIDASLVNPRLEMDSLMYYENEMERPPLRRIPLGNVFAVNKHKLDASEYKKTLKIPDLTDTFPVLKLFTTVTVYGGDVLAENDSSITLPKQFYDFRNTQASEVEFWYEQGEKPGIESIYTHSHFQALE